MNAICGIILQIKIVGTIFKGYSKSSMVPLDRTETAPYLQKHSCCRECQHGLAMRKVCVCPSIIRVHYDKTEERSV